MVFARASRPVDPDGIGVWSSTLSLGNGILHPRLRRAGIYPTGTTRPVRRPQIAAGFVVRKKVQLSQPGRVLTVGSVCIVVKSRTGASVLDPKGNTRWRADTGWILDGPGWPPLHSCDRRYRRPCWTDAA